MDRTWIELKIVVLFLLGSTFHNLQQFGHLRICFIFIFNIYLLCTHLLAYGVLLTQSPFSIQKRECEPMSIGLTHCLNFVNNQKNTHTHTDWTENYNIMLEERAFSLGFIPREIYMNHFDLYISNPDPGLVYHFNSPS